MPIDMNDKSNPHHSLLHKPALGTGVEDDLDLDLSIERVGGSLKKATKPGMPQNPPIIKDSVCWWGWPKKR